MGDEREGARGPDAASERRLRSGGRSPGRPEPYPRVNQTDIVERTSWAEAAVEPRSFDPSLDAPPSRESDCECAPNERRLGPEGDPAEGKP
jgi:hypothetical protein